MKYLDALILTRNSAVSSGEMVSPKGRAALRVIDATIKYKLQWRAYLQRRKFRTSELRILRPLTLRKTSTR